MARRGGNHRRGGVGIDGNIALALMLIAALPIVGLIKIAKGKSNDEKGLGIILLIVGIVLWIVLAVASN
jgi:hypothetical protein